MYQAVACVPERHYFIQVFLVKRFHPLQAVYVEGASGLGIAFQGKPAQNGFQADPGL